MAILPTRPVHTSQNIVWDINTLSWVKMTQPIINGGTVVISGTIAVSGPLTNTELRAAPVVITGAVIVL